MGIKKWVMKQQWRIVQIRGIWTLFYGILLLAITYVKYVPGLADMETLGPFVFSGIILIIFLFFGYLYDRVLFMWAPSQEVNLERNPYQYVPSPKDHVFWFPIYSALLDVSEELATHFDLDRTTIRETREYYSEMQALRPERNEDIDKGIELREKFAKTHQFSDIIDDEDS
ncbi:MAG: hypothetical protein OEV85_09170 [Candidatus Thorarchaeota archaeon]|nr:hypothetical protein [Candidatus Thorarchaeota archaeon]